MWPGRTWPSPSISAARAQQLHDVGRDVAGDVLPRGLEQRVAPGGQADRVARDDADPQRRGLRRAEQARVAVRGADLAVDDPLVPELRAAEERVVGVDQALVAAPVRRQRGLRAGGPGGLDVGVDVGAAERVDRLLRVPDQDQRRRAVAERGLHDPPLHGVGVLELVDEHDAVAVAQARRGDFPALALERAAEAGQQVVVAHDAHAPLAGLELLAGGAGEPHPHRLDRAVGRVGGLERRVRVVDRRARDRQRLGAAELRDAAAVEAAQVEVVDDLVAEVADVLHERGVGLDVAEHAEAAEHLLAEAVRGRDGRGVEVGEGARRAARAGPRRLDGAPVASSATTASSSGGAPASARSSPCSALDQPLADALAQLAGGHAREGDHQDLLERDALGHVAGGERGDRERLAGARARLEHGHAGRERAADVEGLGHRCSTCSQREHVVPQPARVGVERGGPEQVVEGEDAAERELVLEVLALARRSSTGRPTPWWRP